MSKRVKKSNSSKSKKGNTGATQERRFLSNGELRVQSDNNVKKIVGYAAKFSPALSNDLGGWKETLDPHCFDACLVSNPDVRALWNHDANHILGRTTAGTLRLSIDATGLFYQIDPPETQVAIDLMKSISRGDISQSSFGFVCLEDVWNQDANGNIIRTVLKATVFDVSPVTFAAYPDATSLVRANLRSCPLNLRSKLSKRDEDDDDGHCDPESPDYDEDADDCEDEDRDTSDSTSTCTCDEVDEQERQLHFELILRKLRS